MRHTEKIILKNSRSAVALLFTLVILAVLSTLAYTTASRQVSVEHRQNYIHSYYKAKYACDSATRYSIALINDIDLTLESREGMPDFSDILFLTEEEYEEMIFQWQAQLQELRLEKYEQYQQRQSAGSGRYDTANEEQEDDYDLTSKILDLYGVGEANYFGVDMFGYMTPIDANSLYVPGPYGAPWPYLTEPKEMELSEAKITITIEDESAKYPAVWALMKNEDIQREKQASLQTFYEWMGILPDAQLELNEQFEQAAEIKGFEFDMKPATIEKREAVRTRTVTQDADGTRKSVFRTRYRVRQVPRSPSGNNADYARLVSALINTDLLKRDNYQTIHSSAPIRYFGLWGSSKVNINTAPRHVLEATFVFGGKEVELADAVIIERAFEPFADLEDMKDRLYRFSDSIDKIGDYVIFNSEVFTITVKAVSGAATAKSVTAVLREDNKFTKIATVYN